MPRQTISWDIVLSPRLCHSSCRYWVQSRFGTKQLGAFLRRNSGLCFEQMSAAATNFLSLLRAEARARGREGVRMVIVGELEKIVEKDDRVKLLEDWIQELAEGMEYYNLLGGTFYDTAEELLQDISVEREVGQLEMAKLQKRLKIQELLLVTKEGDQQAQRRIGVRVRKIEEHWGKNWKKTIGEGRIPHQGEDFFRLLKKISERTSVEAAVQLFGKVVADRQKKGSGRRWKEIVQLRRRDCLAVLNQMDLNEAVLMEKRQGQRKIENSSGLELPLGVNGEIYADELSSSVVPEKERDCNSGESVSLREEVGSKNTETEEIREQNGDMEDDGTEKKNGDDDSGTGESGDEDRSSGRGVRTNGSKNTENATKCASGSRKVRRKSLRGKGLGKKRVYMEIIDDSGDERSVEIEEVLLKKKRLDIGRGSIKEEDIVSLFGILGGTPGTAIPIAKFSALIVELVTLLGLRVDEGKGESEEQVEAEEDVGKVDGGV